MPDKDLNVASVFCDDTKTTGQPSVDGVAAASPSRALDKAALIVQAELALGKYQHVLKLGTHQVDLVTLIMVGFAADVAAAAFAEVTAGMSFAEAV